LQPEFVLSFIIGNMSTTTITSLRQAYGLAGEHEDAQKFSVKICGICG